jgi:hypothetical protein
MTWRRPQEKSKLRLSRNGSLFGPSILELIAALACDRFVNTCRLGWPHHPKTYSSHRMHRNPDSPFGASLPTVLAIVDTVDG